MTGRFIRKGEFKHGSFLMLALYTTSSVAGAASVVAAFLQTVLRLPLILLAAVIGVVINYFKGREIYDWLEQCYFGIKSSSERFERLGKDRKAFSAIFS